jgi:uncharacterized protein
MYNGIRYNVAMKFVILGFDGPEGQARRKLHRRAHIDKIERWNSRGRVILAGPMTDETGSLIVIEANSREEAEEFVREDPYTAFGVFKRVEIHPFVQVFPAEQCDPSRS